MNELALFAGAGGGILGGKLLGWRTVCAVEINDYCRRVLMQRQDDGILNPFPIWDDICTFDGRPWRGIVDVVSGGFPCQDISAAGKGAGIDGERSGLWSEMARVIGEVRPRFAFVENSPVLTSRGLCRVLGDLAEMGYDAEWGVLGASDAIWSQGTPALYHDRFRIWIKATDASRIQQGRKEQRTERERVRQSGESIGESAYADSVYVERVERKRTDQEERRESRERSTRSQCDEFSWWESEPGVGRVAHGVANRVDRLRAIGNGQVPAVAALAWEALTLTDTEEA